MKIMRNIFSKNEIKKILDELEIRARKSRGQNFLLSEPFARKIVERLQVQEGDTVVEIGPGLGVLSGFLAEKAAKLYLIEIEEKFCSFLKAELPESVTILDNDVCEVDLKGLVGSTKVKVVSNVPYSISTDVILWLKKNASCIDSAVLLLQREFAERLGASPGGKIYGALTVFAKTFCDVELCERISGAQFFPEAEVESRVVRLRVLAKPRVAPEHSEFFSTFVKMCFSKRRKTIRNAVAAFVKDKLPKDEVSTLFERLGIDGNLRAENLELDDFYKIAKELL